MKKLLVIDNYDSFTYNLVQMFMRHDLSILTCRNDGISLDKAEKINPDCILISPGPGAPGGAGISMAVIMRFFSRIPILGVCLGLQCVNEVFGGKTIPAKNPMHGKTSDVRHNNEGLFSGLPSPFTAARYHSLEARPGTETLDDLFVTARAKENVIMGLSHKIYPLHAVQFHPESFLTEHGFMIIENFLKIESMAYDKKRPQG